MKRFIKTITLSLFLLMFAPLVPSIMAQDGSDAEKKTEVVTIYEYKEHPITPNDYLFRTVFWGACFVVVVTIIVLFRTMVRMEELKANE